MVVLSYVEIVLAVIGLGVLVARGLWREYWALGSLLALRVLSEAMLLVVLHRAGHLHAAYQVYFYVYWGAFAVESVLGVFVLLGIYRDTMTPLRGLRRLGTVLLAVVAGCGMLAAVVTTVTSGNSGIRFMLASIATMRLVEEGLTLGLLGLVLFAVGKLGLSARAKWVGVSAGLALSAAVSLVLSARAARGANAYARLEACATCAVMLIWTVYLALPEPERSEMRLGEGSWLMRWDAACVGGRR